MRFYKEQALLREIKKTIQSLHQSPAFTAFDADGTLWLEDANHILFHYQKKHKLRDFTPFLEASYQKKINRSQKCELFASLQAGLSREDFKLQCLEALKTHPLQVFEFQRELLNFLKEQEIEVYIVTASVKWLVEEAVRFYDLPVDKVFGVHTTLQEDRISSQVILPVTYGKGKKEILASKVKQSQFLLGAGNTLSDLDFMSESIIPLAIQSSLPEGKDFNSEKELKEIAQKNKWFVFERNLSN